MQFIRMLIHIKQTRIGVFQLHGISVGRILRQCVFNGNYGCPAYIRQLLYPLLRCACIAKLVAPAVNIINKRSFFTVFVPCRTKDIQVQLSFSLCPING